MNSNYPYWTCLKRIPPPTINNSLYFLYWFLLREFSAVMQQNKTVFFLISLGVTVDYFVQSLSQSLTVFAVFAPRCYCAEFFNSIVILWLPQFRLSNGTTVSQTTPGIQASSKRAVSSHEARAELLRPAQLFFTEVTSWAYSDTGIWKLFWATLSCYKSMRAKIFMKKWCPMPHFPPCTYHETSEEDGNTENSVLLLF